MGGYGSGRPREKTPVEECLPLDVKTLRKGVDYGPGYSGSVYWTRGSNPEPTDWIGYRIEEVHARLAVRLKYTTTHGWTGEKRDSDYSILLQTTWPHFGGVRWWFTCPLVVRDVPCGRRVGKLYIPPGGTYFGCRHCYNLTYRSTQQYDKRVAWFKKHPGAMLAALRLRSNTPMSALKAALDRW